MNIQNDRYQNMDTPFFDPKLESEFCNLIKSALWYEPVRKCLEESWENYRPYKQPGFHKTILTDGDKSFALMWEMHLASQLVTHGFTLCKTCNEEPDLRLDINGQTVWIECCVPDKGDFESEKVFGLDMKNSSQQVEAFYADVDPVLCRWTSSLKSKFEQYQKRIQKRTCTPDQPYIIAINGDKAGFPYYKGRMPDIMGAVYGMGSLCVPCDESGMDMDKMFYEHRGPLSKRNGSLISTRFFCDDAHKGIAGVIYTQDSPFSLGRKDYCYVENVLSPHRGDLGFGCFMGTFDYSSDGRISVKTSDPSSHL